ncbi:DUF4198 domain-containing protein [Halochromatium salexigens]|uniref:DUF4198 domain-containing protein n=1 Tax=Halochromatium salexigens TaxID=49447 RepID=UPI0019130EFC|nr:DUF4198 domain-containing protein [Halochromatium salexigens]
MITLNKAVAILATQWMLMSSGAWAHDYWIMPSDFDPSPGTLLEAGFTASHQFFVDEEIPNITDFRGFLVLPDGREISLPYQRIAPTNASLLAPILGEGTYTLGAVSTRPEYWSTTRSGHAPGRKRESADGISTTAYVKSVKTYVNVGQPSEAWRAHLGHAIEIVPLNNPASLKTGDSLTLKILLHDQVAAGAEVYAVYEGFESKDHEAPVSTTTDAQGQARISIDRPGLWLVYARVEREAAPDSGLDWHNDRAYLLMKVAPNGQEARP